MTESTSGRTAKSAPIGLIVLVYSVSLAFLASCLRLQYGFPLDDSYIHQTVARNFARTGVLGFVPGVPSSGATSVLWACIQAMNHRFTHLDPVIFNLILSWILLPTIGVLLFLLAGRDRLPMPQRLAFALAPACCGNFMWLALIGMEHLLFVAVALGCIYLWFDEPNARSAFYAGICAGVLCLIRPEGIIFGPVLAVAAAKDKRPIRDILAVVTPWLLGVAVLFSVDLYTSHSLLPATLQGRTWLYLRTIGGPHSLQSILNFLILWIPRLRLQFAVWHAGSSHFAVLRVLPPFVLAVAGAVWLIANAAPRIRFLFLFAALHTCVYLVKFPVNGHGGRYQPLDLLLLFPCMFFGLLYLMQRVAPHTRTATALSLAVLCVAGIASLRTWRTVSAVGIAHINNTHGLAAQWLLHNTPASAKVASLDIGRISYDLDRSIIDLGGLVNASYFPYLQNHQVQTYLREQHADYLVTPPGFESELGFPPASPPQLSRLAEFCSPQDNWMIGWIYTAHAEQCQIIYKIPPLP